MRGGGESTRRTVRGVCRRLALAIAQPIPNDPAIPFRRRIARLLQYGLIMAAGTLTLFWWALHTYGEERALTLAFTTFVLFQFFNVMNARNEDGSAFNRQMFTNGKLWLALSTVLALQVVAVHWPPAQAIFHTVDLSFTDWMLATGVAASILMIEELRKLLRERYRQEQ